MGQIEILEEIKILPTKARLEIIEVVIHQLQEDFQQIDRQPIWIERKQQLATAAKTLLPHYKDDKELTTFTLLDSEDFYV